MSATRSQRAVAAATAATLIGGAAAFGFAPTASAATPLSIESGKVLELALDGSLADIGSLGADVTVHVDTTFGDADADAAVAADRSVSKSFSTRQAQIAAGGVTITAEAMIDGRAVTAEVTADYPATTCR